MEPVIDDGAIFGRVRELIAETFFIEDVSDIDDATTFDGIADWDSLGYTEVVMGLEQAYSIRIQPKKIYAARSVGDVVGLVREALAEAQEHP